MNPWLILLLIIISLVLLLTFAYILTYNKIQHYIIRLNESESQIDDSLRNKLDILINLEKIINSNVSMSMDNFKELNEKDVKISNFEMDRQLSKVADTFSKIREDYPDDLDLESYRNLVIDLKIVEEKNTAAKTYYNKYTTKLNIMIKKFPSNIVARIHGIKERNYFDNKNMNDEDIFDFKY